MGLCLCGAGQGGLLAVPDLLLHKQTLIPIPMCLCNERSGAEGMWGEQHNPRALILLGRQQGLSHISLVTS